MAKKKSTLEDLRKKADPDIQKDLDESYRKLFSLRLQRETLQLANHREIPRTKRLIARLKTVQRQREIATAMKEASE
jgi:large subunit ribosomal protein L29